MTDYKSEVNHPLKKHPEAFIQSCNDLSGMLVY